MARMKFLFLFLVLLLNAAAIAQNLSFVGSYNSLAYVMTISVQDNYAYIGAYSGIHIVDVSDPSHPTHAGRVSETGVMIIRAMDDYAYIGTNDAFNIYGLSNPIYPNFLGNCFIYYANGFFLNSHYAYVSENAEYYKIIDISNPESLNVVGYFEDIACGDGFIAHDSLAFLADWDGLRIWNLSDPIHPQLIGHLAGLFLYSVMVENDIAYTAASGNSLFIIDVSGPTSPAVLSEYATEGGIASEVVSDNYVFLAEGAVGIEVVNVSDPANPTFATSYDTPGDAYELCVSGDYVYVADNSSLQILRFDPTGIENGEDLPKEFSLSQNYPNPFNASTTFEYDLPKSADAELAIYNLQGQKVAIILDARQSAGRHTLTWNANGFSSGIYFARLEADGQAKTLKLAILK